jgi:hypothetical protein
VRFKVKPRDHDRLPHERTPQKIGIEKAGNDCRPFMILAHRWYLSISNEQLRNVALSFLL